MNARSLISRNDSMPRDLRAGSSDGAGAGNFYEVSPCAATRLKIILALRERRKRPLLNKLSVVKSDKPEAGVKKEGVVVMSEKTGVDLSVYPEEVVEAAKVELAKEEKRARRYADVFTPEVVAVWQAWKENGRSVEWIGQNNGLIKVSGTVVHTYMFKHRDAALAIRGKVGFAEENAAKKAKLAGGQETVVPETTVQPVKATAEPEPPVHEGEDQAQPDLGTAAADDAMQPVSNIQPYMPTKPANLPAYLDRDYQPVPRVGDTLGNLIRLLNDERVTIEGEVDLKLKIKFGGK